MSVEHPAPERVLAETFAELARLLAAERTVEDLLALVVVLATQTIAPCEIAGVTHIVGGKVTSPASTGDIALIMDQIQREVGEGPAVDALRTHEVYRTGNLRVEQRWPRFSSRASRETGVASIVSVRLFLDQDTLGSLNLYSRERDAFDDADVAVAAMFATHVSVALHSANRSAHLAARGDSRDLIGRAKGILMALRQVDDGGAFRLLVEASQRLNVKLLQVAEDVNLTGDIRLPEHSRSRPMRGNGVH